MYRTIDDFLTTWEYEQTMTAKLFDNLTDTSLEQRITPGSRSLGELTWHLVMALRAIPGAAGLQVDGPSYEEPVPTSAAMIADSYRQTARSFVDQVKAQWHDAMLANAVTMWGTPSTYGTALRDTLLHQAHHRGQVTVLMKQAGVPIVGIYGPTKEEMEAMQSQG